MDRLEKYLHDEFGLSLDSIGRERAVHKVRSLMHAAGFFDSGAYIDALSRSEELRQRLFDAVTVAESWFFRDEAPFSFLERWATERHQRRPQDHLNLLSIPCAGGEEAYSIAITLLKAGIADSAFDVDAIDINGRLVERAREGVFGSHSFRGVKRDDYADFFLPAPSSDALEVRARVKERIRFAEGNLFALANVLDGRRFDTIFCRNLLIYFSPQSQVRALNILRDRLNPDGVLFLGHAEAGADVLDLFEPCGVAGAFAFNSRTASVSPARGGGPLRETGIKGVVKGAKKRGAVGKSARPHPRVTAMDGVLSTQQKVFLDLKSLADSGNLSKAVEQCDILLDHASDDARVLYLCGVVNEASGRHEKACLLYRRALEVDPHQSDVMFHLAATLEALGETAEARQLKATAGNLKGRQDQQEAGGD